MVIEISQGIKNRYQREFESLRQVEQLRDTKIMIVDDIPFNIQALKGILMQIYNFEIEIAYTGEQALNKVIHNLSNTNEKKKIELIFMDVNMPEMDGMEATKRILEYKKEQNLEDWNIKIIIVTAFCEKVDR